MRARANGAAERRSLSFKTRFSRPVLCAALDTGSRPRKGTGGDAGFIQFRQESLISGSKPGPKAAMRRKNASTTIGAEAFRERIALFQIAYDFTQHNGVCRARKPHTAAGTTLGQDKTATRQIPHHLGKVVVWNPELLGNTRGRQRLIRCIGEPHQDA
nr:hypothetical protein [Steroidobacter denitrificans]